MRTKLLIFLGIVVVGAGAVFYLLRPLKAPTVSTGEASEQTPEITISPEQAAASNRYQLNSTNSEATFAIGEVLLGQKQTTTGSTKQVSGEVVVNKEQPKNSQIGTIRINARTFKTDNTRRDSTIGRFILKSEEDANEFIVFKPTSITGLPTTLPTNPIEFKITGDLSIAGTTRPVVFEATAQLADNALAGNAMTTIKRSQFNISVPLSQSVASVDDEVVLTISFIAESK
ncbi:MAG: YceI family protein [Candidatus Yanofskybacteria bacterium]|nr:YceI family protein [Candidatus Yanofskybacteria bacterium]